MGKLALLTPGTILKPEDLTSTTKTFQNLDRKWNASDVVVSDIEGDNLLYRLKKFHCGVVLNPFTLEESIYVPNQSAEYLKKLDKYGVVVGHNFRGFDLLALAKLFDYRYHGFCFDTLVLSRLLNPERLLHSLEGWGHQLKFHKGEYKAAFKAKVLARGEKYVDGMEWLEFNQDMLDYCIQDVRLNAVLFLYFITRLGWYDWFGVTKEECDRCALAIRKGDIRRI